GAAINRDFGRRISLLEDGKRPFEPGLFYAKDAFEGLEIMDKLTADAGVRDSFVERMKNEAIAFRDKQKAPAASGTSAGTVSAVKAEIVEPPKPPFWGTRTLRDIDLRALWPCFDLRSLYRLSWGASNTKGEAFEKLVHDDFDPRLQR